MWMWSNESENFGDLLSACDFSQAAIDVFKKLRLTEADKPISTAKNALAFAYNSLPTDLFLSEDERQILTPLSQMAHLFDITDFESEPSLVRFFSVDLGVKSTERSQIQYAVHSIIAKKAPYCSVAIFRNDEAISMSVSLYKITGIKTIFLSDWYKLYSAELDEFFAVIGTSIFSLKNGVDFISDFIYLIARDYYIHPLSYEYLRYERNTNESFFAQVIEKYGEDYVTDAFIKTSNAKLDTTDEIDFDLLEYKLEQVDLADSEEFSDEFDEEFVQISTLNSKGGGLVVEEIPKDVLADPVLLLEWLDKHSSEKSMEVEKCDTQILDMINGAYIDYIDHRGKGGCLWIIGGAELSDFVMKCKAIGVEFHFKEGGGKATSGFDAWWCK